MTKTAIVGFPRIGEKRELKWAVEKYLKKVVDKDELLTVGFDLREKHWKLQQQFDIDYIPSNDFSHYDNVLDAAFMFNMIPARYRDAGLNFTDTYFSMARGYQNGSLDLKSLEMKKWFNTNYHYIVPEIDDSTDFRLINNKIFEEYNESKRLGIKTKPVIIGPLSLLKLSRVIQPGKSYHEYAYSIIKVYMELLVRFKLYGCEMIQFDEPAFAMDLSDKDKDHIKSIYKILLHEKDDMKVMIQTYFGDVRDIYEVLTTLEFDAIGLDFVEGAYNLELIKEYGFPKDKELFIGIINGKNIWNNNYKTSLELLNEIAKHVSKDQIVLNTSCSLLHVPFSVAHEQKIEEKYKKHLCFAEEKLQELQELALLFNEEKYIQHELYKKNQNLIKEKIRTKDFIFPEVREKVESLSSEDFERDLIFSDRIKNQKESLKLPLLPTTTIGSFPQTGEVRKLRSAFRKNEISDYEYEVLIKKKIDEVIRLQEKIGLDVLVHGEYERNDMVEYFGEHLTGFLFTENGWVQSYGTRCVKPPVIFGDIKREAPITVKWITYAQEQTKKPVKGMLTGPVTILNWSFPREDIEKKDIALQIALAIRDEVLDLEKAGIKIIQIDEAALREKLPLRQELWNEEYLDWAIAAFKLAHSAVKSVTQIHTHMCYSEFSDIMEKIKEMDADVISIEAAKSDLSILDSLKEHKYDKEIGPGIYDIHSPRIPDIKEMQLTIKNMKEKLAYENLWINPDCGLKTRDMDETIKSLENMVTATRRVRRTL